MMPVSSVAETPSALPSKTAVTTLTLTGPATFAPLFYPVGPETGYYYRIIEDAVAIHGYRGTDEHVVIPSSIHGMKVTSVEMVLNYDGSYQSYFLSGLIKSITIPDGVTWIGDRTFSKMSKLTSITVPASVTYIGDQAFNCYLYFDDCNNVVITCPRDSYTHEYCMRKGIQFQLAEPTSNTTTNKALDRILWIVGLLLVVVLVSVLILARRKKTSQHPL